jgi:hypothetical protein
MRNKGGEKEDKLQVLAWDFGDGCSFLFKFGRHLEKYTFSFPLTPAELI